MSIQNGVLSISFLRFFIPLPILKILVPLDRAYFVLVSSKNRRNQKQKSNEQNTYPAVTEAREKMLLFEQSCAGKYINVTS